MKKIIKLFVLSILFLSYQTVNAEDITLENSQELKFLTELKERKVLEYVGLVNSIKEEESKQPTTILDSALNKNKQFKNDNLEKLKNELILKEMELEDLNKLITAETNLILSRGKTTITKTVLDETNLPVDYQLDKYIDDTNYVSDTYPYGQCTWYVYNRAKQFGINYDPYMGNATNWDNKETYNWTNTPTKHTAIVFENGQHNSHYYYGHVGFVEEVFSDGSVLYSDSNSKGLGTIAFYILTKDESSQFKYVFGK